MSCSSAASRTLRSPVEPVPRLQLDGLPQHGQAVLVDVLVPVMLVSLHPEPGHLGQHLVRHPGLDQHVDAERRVGGKHQLGQLPGDPLGRHDIQPRRLRGHGRAHVVRDPEPEPGREPGRAQDTQRIIAERLLRRPRRAQHLVPQRVKAAERVGDLVSRQPGRHRVDGEVPAAQVLLQGLAVPHVGLARGQAVLLAAVGRDLEDHAALAQPHRAEGDPDRPHLVGPPLDGGQHLVRGGVGGEVEVAGPLPQENVPDRPADQRELVAVPGEQAAKLLRGGYLLTQERGRRAALFVAHRHGHRE